MKKIYAGIAMIVLNTVFCAMDSFGSKSANLKKVELDMKRNEIRQKICLQCIPKTRVEKSSDADRVREIEEFINESSDADRVREIEDFINKINKIKIPSLTIDWIRELIEKSKTDLEKLKGENFLENASEKEITRIYEDLPDFRILNAHKLMALEKIEREKKIKDMIDNGEKIINENDKTWKELKIRMDRTMEALNTGYSFDSKDAGRYIQADDGEKLAKASQKIETIVKAFDDYKKQVFPVLGEGQKMFLALTNTGIVEDLGFPEIHSKMLEILDTQKQKIETLRKQYNHMYSKVTSTRAKIKRSLKSFGQKIADQFKKLSKIFSRK